MIFQIFVAISLLVLIKSATINQSKNKGKQGSHTEEDRLNEFFSKYCKETDKKMLAKLEKCEEIQPENIKQIELECVKKVLNISQNPSYDQIKNVECNDEDLGPKYDECENQQMKNMTMKNGDQAKLGEIAKKIMFCGFDCYGIKHD